MRLLECFGWLLGCCHPAAKECCGWLLGRCYAAARMLWVVARLWLYGFSNVLYGC